MPGRKISRRNMERIQSAADHLYALGAKPPAPDASPIGSKAESLGDTIEAVARAAYRMSGEGGSIGIEDVYDGYVVLCQYDLNTGNETYWRADYAMGDTGSVTLAARDAWVQVEEVWQPVTTSAKGLDIGPQGSATACATLKALGNRQIEVKVAFGGHNRGRDSHNEYFSPRTDFDTENFPSPPLLYYHGFDEHGRKMGKPVVTGKMLSRRTEPDGHVLVYQLKAGKYADRQWEAALKSECAVSPGTVGHLIRKAPDGELEYWPLAEVSAWDAAPSRKQANLYSVAAPVLKAVYIEAGLAIPAIVDTPPEAPGDGASADAIDPETAAKTIAAEVARVLLARRQA